MQIKTTRTALGAALAAAVLALTACAGNPGGPTTGTATSTPTAVSPSATPTPTAPASVPPPTSDKEALDQSMVAINAFGKVLDNASRTKNGDPAALKAVSTKQALDWGTQYVTKAATDKTTYTGEVKNSLISGFTGDLTYNGKAYPHGSAQLQVCEDSSNVVGTNPDGSPASKPSVPRVTVGYWTEYDPANARWLVTKTFQDGTNAC
ncbi:hypothetical protein SPF06_21505 [Sinomonas sp. JGH33]|uniref:Lipoprotein n=1 Tax=Sinomonas terricola TaxID=3110330 RepID=A0ABU5TCN4_9MICC|nr:hypothetical protein [Sinomonas sp. JGH33]MEA5457302.1 hypothetical protein [Sinomonas sp. JGH33]